jgi:hypothetical protein
MKEHTAVCTAARDCFKLNFQRGHEDEVIKAASCRPGSISFLWVFLTHDAAAAGSNSGRRRKKKRY